MSAMTLPIALTAGAMSATGGAIWWGIAGGVGSLLLNAATDGPERDVTSWMKTGALIGAGLGVAKTALFYGASQVGMTSLGDALAPSEEPSTQFASLWEGRPWLVGLVGVAVGGYLINTAFFAEPSY